MHDSCGRRVDSREHASTVRSRRRRHPWGARATSGVLRRSARSHGFAGPRRQRRGATAPRPSRRLDALARRARGERAPRCRCAASRRAGLVLVAGVHTAIERVFLGANAIASPSRVGILLVGWRAGTRGRLGLHPLTRRVPKTLVCACGYRTQRARREACAEPPTSLFNESQWRSHPADTQAPTDVRADASRASGSRRRHVRNWRAHAHRRYVRQ